MERPLAVIRLRAPDWRAIPQHCFDLLSRFRLLLVPFLVLGLLPFSASSVHAASQLWLPTPPGEHWKIIQGYGCGTHNSWDKYALDMANADGKTYGAPVRAAADGEVFVWVPKSGTLILSHGGNFYTQYTHMSSTNVHEGATVKRGDVIGAVGDRGAPGNPHLHFHAFTASGPWASHRKTVPLSFAEGYDLPDVGGCSQHQGQVMVAGMKQDMALSGLEWGSEVQPGAWYNHDITMTFQGSAIARGFTAAWGADPGGEAPAQGADSPAQVQLAALGEGLHTLYVRGWDAQGQQTLATFGPVGYDVTAPTAGATSEAQTVAANSAAAVVRWNAAQDAASGVAGYHVYLGPDANGTSDWYVGTAETAVNPLAPGSYTLRIQPVDYAGNVGEWATVGAVIAQ